MSVASDNPTYMIPDYFRNPVLRPYLSNVRDWQGYIRFLGLPHRREHPDVIIDRLFVEPLLTRRYVSPDESPENWLDEAEPLLDVMSENRPLVLLGDPGIGKSTLLNNVAWLLSRPSKNALVSKFGWHLPLPMVLRELPIKGVTSFDDLLDTFLSQDMSAPLRADSGQYVKEALAEGQVFLLLDGIDEIGDRPAREDLRRAVFDGISRYPNCRWLLSSRIVGYDEVPFNVVHDRRDDTPQGGEWKVGFLEESVRDTPNSLRRVSGIVDEGRVLSRYIAPFDDRRIAAFAHNWYLQRETAALRAGTNANHLVRAVHADESILRLARVPNLLTMMALIHRVEATLPHGRALLYERIVEAYLESIDKFRGIDSSPHELTRKQGWLARVGYEMQRRRTSVEDAAGREILVDFDTVLGWLSEEMGRGKTLPGSPSAREFLDIVGRRSGLFLPRGEGRYAFVHLSFQEYFAAVAFVREVTRLRWAKGGDSRLGFDRKKLAQWAGVSVWRETFSFVFELLAAQEEDDWYAELLENSFGPDFSRLNESTRSKQEVLNLGHLLARLVVNSRSGLSTRERAAAIATCVRVQLRNQSTATHGVSSRVHRVMQSKLVPQSIFIDLLGRDGMVNAEVFDEIGVQMKDMGISELNLAGVQISELPALENFPALYGCSLARTNISDLSSLETLTTLEYLSLLDTPVSDISPLGKLTPLKFLYLSGTKVSDLTPLGRLTALEYLDLKGAPVSDLAPLRKLVMLKGLHLWGEQICELRALSALVGLKELGLWGTRVSNLSPLARMTALESLDLWNYGVLDLTPLNDITSVKRLTIWGGQISDLSPINGMKGLEYLQVFDTPIEDLTFLSNMTALKWLDLSETLVSDLAPITKLDNLQFLHLSGTEISNRTIQGIRASLPPNCKVYWTDEKNKRYIRTEIKTSRVS